MPNLYTICVQTIAVAILACLTACTKETPIAQPKPSSGNDTASKAYIGFRVNGVRDLAVDTAPHTNVMALEIVPDAPDTALFAISVEDLPKGVSCSVAKGSGPVPAKTTLHFSYDYTGATGTYPANIVVQKGDSLKRFGFNIVVPDTVSRGWVFAGRKSSRPFVQYIYDPSDFKNMLYANTSILSTDPTDTIFRFHFDPRLYPLPKRDSNLILSSYDQRRAIGIVSFEVRHRNVPYPMNSVIYRHPFEGKVAVKYYFNDGKPRVKATGVVVQPNQFDTLTRRIISFDVQMR